jgi:PadR family transcriptional regulator, regulatory protein AphA
MLKRDDMTTIHYAILGLLSERPMTGYDLKKKMQGSLYMYWSGNNNQIYKALLQLSSNGLLKSEIQHQDGAPSKKICFITDKGRAELQEWIYSTQPEVPEFRKPFLIQMAFAGKLKPVQIEEVLLKYKDELNSQLIMQQEKQRRIKDTKNHTKQEKFIENMIFDNIFKFYQSELEWAQKVLEGVRKNFREEQ